MSEHAPSTDGSITVVARRQRPVARWKMCLVSVCIVYPLSMLLVLGPVAVLLPSLLAHFVTMCCSIPLMKYGVMPQVTRLLGFWLFPVPKKSAPAAGLGVA